MSTPPEKIIANYDSKSKQSKIVAAEMKKIVERYKDKRITKENVCVLVSTLMLQANNLKTILLISPRYSRLFSTCAEFYL